MRELITNIERAVPLSYDWLVRKRGVIYFANIFEEKSVGVNCSGTADDPEEALKRAFEKWKSTQQSSKDQLGR